MAIGLSFGENNMAEGFKELTEEEIREHAQRVLEHSAQKVASFFNSMNLNGEQIDLIQSLREINAMLTEENRTLETAIHHLFKEAETVRTEAVKEFANMLISKSENGVINVSDIPDFVVEMVGEKKC